MKSIYVIYLFAIILSFNFMNTEQVNNYKQEKVSIIIDYLKKNKRKIDSFDYQLDTNSAFVYILQNGEIILLPGNLASYENGLIVKSKETFNKMVKEDFFPVEVIDMYQYEIYNKELLNLSEHINENIINLEKVLNIEISNKAKYDDHFFKTFNEAIKKVDLKNNRDNYTLSLSILLGEIIIKNKGGYWKIIKEYGVYNPYYIPYVVLNDNEVELEVMERIMTDLEQPQYFDLKKSYDFLTDPRLNMQLNVEAQKIYQTIKKNEFGNTED